MSEAAHAVGAGAAGGDAGGLIAAEILGRLRVLGREQWAEFGKVFTAQTTWLDGIATQYGFEIARPADRKRKWEDVVAPPVLAGTPKQHETRKRAKDSETLSATPPQPSLSRSPTLPSQPSPETGQCQDRSEEPPAPRWKRGRPARKAATKRTAAANRTRDRRKAATARKNSEQPEDDSMALRSPQPAPRALRSRTPEIVFVHEAKADFERAEREREEAREAERALLMEERARAAEADQLERDRVQQHRRTEHEQRVQAELKERLELERLVREERGREAERMLAAAEADAERSRIEAAKAEQERLEQERLEQERLERERERLIRERLERKRREREERLRKEQERMERERLERERLEEERIERERLEHERRAREQKERERAELERLRREQAERDRLAREQRERAEREERQQAEMAERERLELERLERERVERERVERERLERERLERERVKREEHDRVERQRLAEREWAEQAARDEAELLIVRQREEQARVERERLEREREAQERLAQADADAKEVSREREVVERALLQAEAAARTRQAIVEVESVHSHVTDSPARLQTARRQAELFAAKKRMQAEIDEALVREREREQERRMRAAEQEEEAREMLEWEKAQQQQQQAHANSFRDVSPAIEDSGSVLSSSSVNYSERGPTEPLPELPGDVKEEFDSAEVKQRAATRPQPLPPASTERRNEADASVYEVQAPPRPQGVAKRPQETPRPHAPVSTAKSRPQGMPTTAMSARAPAVGGGHAVFAVPGAVVRSRKDDHRRMVEERRQQLERQVEERKRILLEDQAKRARRLREIEEKRRREKEILARREGQPATHAQRKRREDDQRLRIVERQKEREKKVELLRKRPEAATGTVAGAGAVNVAPQSIVPARVGRPAGIGPVAAAASNPASTGILDRTRVRPTHPVHKPGAPALQKTESTVSKPSDAPVGDRAAASRLPALKQMPLPPPARFAARQSPVVRRLPAPASGVSSAASAAAAAVAAAAGSGKGSGRVALAAFQSNSGLHSGASRLRVGGGTGVPVKQPSPLRHSSVSRTSAALLLTPPGHGTSGRIPSSQNHDDNNYEMTPYRSESDVDSEEEENRRRAKLRKAPRWAKGAALRGAIGATEIADPDQIFPPERNCELDELVPRKKKQRRRGSSANWYHDRVTWKEEIEYKQRMGYLDLDLL